MGSILLMTIAVLLIAIGGFLLKRGRWPRRAGDTPHCRKCDYVLSGTQTRCPECGTVARADTVIRGERIRRPGMTMLGSGMAFLGLALLAMSVANSVAWNRFEPLGWLLNDLGSSNYLRSSGAWTEIKHRIDGNLLSDDQQNAVVERGLQLQAAGNASLTTAAVLDFVGSRYLDHKLTAEQADRFFANALKVKLTTRPIIGAQSPVPYLIAGTGRGPGQWMMRMRTLESQIDDDGPILHLGGSVGTSFGGWTSAATLQPVATPGKHRLRIKVELGADPSNAFWNSNTPSIWKTTQDLLADFQVIEGTTPITTVTTPDASVLRPMLLTPRLEYIPANPRWLNVQVGTTGLPVDVAFDVFIRCNGKEYPAGAVSYHKGGPSNRGITAFDFPPNASPPVDVIFRSSESVAAATIDMTQIWKGEIVIKNVAITRPPSAAPPTTAPSQK